MIRQDTTRTKLQARTHRYFRGAVSYVPRSSYYQIERHGRGKNRPLFIITIILHIVLESLQKTHHPLPQSYFFLPRERDWRQKKKLCPKKSAKKTWAATRTHFQLYLQSHTLYNKTAAHERHQLVKEPDKIKINLCSPPLWYHWRIWHQGRIHSKASTASSMNYILP